MASCIPSPSSIVCFSVSNARLVMSWSLTVISAVAEILLSSLLVAVTMTLPAFNAVTTPFSSTVAMDLSDESQVVPCNASAGVISA